MAFATIRVPRVFVLVVIALLLTLVPDLQLFARFVQHVLQALVDGWLTRLAPCILAQIMLAVTIQLVNRGLGSLAEAHKDNHPMAVVYDAGKPRPSLPHLRSAGLDHNPINRKKQERILHLNGPDQGATSLLISKGAIWFEYVASEPNDPDIKAETETGDLTPSQHKVTLSPAELTFGTASTSPSYFDLPSEHDGWHDVLDSVVARLEPTISGFFPNEADGFVKAKCELLSYAAAYEAKLWSGTVIPQIVWNTLVSSVENRIFGRIDFAPNLSGYREHADGSREFISYASVYVTHMRDLERIIDLQYRAEDYDFKELLSVFSPKEDLLTKDAVAEFSQVFERSVFLCSDELIPTLKDFA